MCIVCFSAAWIQKTERISSRLTYFSLYLCVHMMVKPGDDASLTVLGSGFLLFLKVTYEGMDED